MEKLKLLVVEILVVILVLILGSTTKLKTPRNIKLDGAVGGNVDFDGSGDVTITTTQDNIVALTGIINLTDGNGSADIAYPLGYSKENSCVIAYYCNVNSGWNDYGVGQSAVVLGVSLRADKIKFTSSPISNGGPNGSKQFKIIIMKI